MSQKKGKADERGWRQAASPWAAARSAIHHAVSGGVLGEHAISVVAGNPEAVRFFEGRLPGLHFCSARKAVDPEPDSR